MTTPIIRRRRRRHRPAHEIAVLEGWVEALGDADAASKDHGALVLLHRRGCPKNDGGPVCDCCPVIIGPTVRGVWQ